MRADNTGVGSLNPTRVTIKALLEKKAIESHLIKFNSLEKTKALSSLPSAILEIEYAKQKTSNCAMLLQVEVKSYSNLVKAKADSSASMILYFEVPNQHYFYVCCS